MLYGQVRQGNVSEVRTALKEQPSLLDARDIRSPNRSALHIAACESHEDMVRLLLRRGANPWIGVGLLSRGFSSLHVRGIPFLRL